MLLTPRVPKRRQRGAMAVLAGLMVVVMLGMGGMVIDLGRLYITRTELQSAMDACALAAASQLQPGPFATPFVLQAADAHGRTMVDPTRSSVSNKGLLQSRTIEPGAVQVEFAPALDGPYASAGGATASTARVARCTYPMSNIAVTMTQILNLSPGAGVVAATTTVGASAVASRAPVNAGNPTNETTCGLFPSFVCKVPGSSAGTNWGLNPGQWIPGPDLTGSPSLAPGSFGWVDFSPPAGGASELALLLSGGNHCGTVAIGAVVGETGANSSVLRAYASRFGIYANGGGLSATANPPDYTGYAYTRTSYGPAAAYTYTPGPPAIGSSVAINAFGNDYLARRASADAFNQVGAGWPSNQFNATTVLTSPQLRAFGVPRRRVVAAPVIDCGALVGGAHTAPVQGFACLFLLRPYHLTGPTQNFEDSSKSQYSPEIEYIGTLEDLDTPCELSGSPGGPGGSGGTSALVPRLVQ